MVCFAVCSGHYPLVTIISVKNHTDVQIGFLAFSLKSSASENSHFYQEVLGQISPRRESLPSLQAKLEHPTTTHCQNKHLKIITCTSEAQIYMWRGNEVGKGGKTHKMPVGLDILSLLKQLGIHGAHFWCISGKFRIKSCIFSSEHKGSCASLHSLVVAQDWCPVKATAV